MKSIIIIILVMALVQPLYSKEYPSSITEYVQTTVAIGVIDSGSGEWRPLGTGILIYNYDVSSQILITNRHILLTSSPSGKAISRSNLSVKANLKSDAKVALKRSHDSWATFDVPLYKEDTLLWTGHPNPTVDVAAVTFPPIDKRHIILSKLSNIKYISKSRMLTIDSLQYGLDVLFIGFPLGLGVKLNPQPIFRYGAISYIDEMNKSFLIDAQVFGGSSGSPVFCTGTSKIPETANNKLLFIGIISGHMYDKLRGYSFVNSLDSATQIDSTTILTENAGLGVVWSVDLINETISLHNERFGENSDKKFEELINDK